MLTKEQLNKLEPLTEHPKYGALVKRAIMNWKKVKPLTCEHGIYSKNNKFKRSPFDEGCCLIGAGLLGLKGSDIRKSLNEKFNILCEESIDLECGFDSWDSKSKHEDYITYKEAYEFGKKVGKIVKPE